MSRGPSEEALARRAVQARADDERALREACGEIAPVARPTLDALLPSFTARYAALAPPAPIEGEAPSALAEAIFDTGRAERVLMAEAIVAVGCARPMARYRAHRFGPAGGQAGMPTLAPSSLGRRLRLAREAGDRAALVQVIEAAEDDDRAPVIAVVDGLRSASTALGDRLVSALGWTSEHGERALARAVLAITEDAYGELRRARIQAVHGRGARASRLQEHGALARTERADDAMPLPDREGIASRWCERIGLSVPPLASGVPAPDAGSSLRLLTGDPEVRPRLLGAPAPDAHGVLELLTVVGELLPLRGAGAGPIAAALGTTRLHGASAATVARQLSLSSAFLVREAAVDRSRIEAVLRELLYVELERLRTLAAQTLALADALERTQGLGERVAEIFGRALGFDHAPRHAPHRVCEAWHEQAPRWLEGAVQASSITHSLIERHDEDWFRNPRAGATLRAAFDAMRTIGPPAPDLDALRRHVADGYRAARA